MYMSVYLMNDIYVNETYVRGFNMGIKNLSCIFK